MNNFSKKECLLNAQAINWTIGWYMDSALKQINNLVKGYSTEWKIEHWDEWKVIRTEYYKQKKDFYKKYHCYVKMLIAFNPQCKIDYQEVTKKMIKVKTKQLILTDYVEEKREPVNTGKYKGFQRKRFN